MVSGVDYTCETIAPAPPECFQLMRAADLPGGRGWASRPKVMALLKKLGYSTPAHFGKQNAVTLNVRLV